MWFPQDTAALRQRRARITYTSPGGQTWQLAGPGQEDQPVTLLPGQHGMFGPDLNVSRSQAVRSRVSLLASRTPEPLELELKVRYDHGRHGKLAHLHPPTVDDFLDGLNAWLDSWPDQDPRDPNPRPGTLAFERPGKRPRRLDVWRTEQLHMLTNRDPLELGKAEMLIVCSPEDPYPYDDTTERAASREVEGGKLVSSSELSSSSFFAAAADWIATMLGNLFGVEQEYEVLHEINHTLTNEGDVATPLDFTVVSGTYTGVVAENTSNGHDWYGSLVIPPIHAGDRVVLGVEEQAIYRSSGVVEPVITDWGMNPARMILPGKSLATTWSSATPCEIEFTTRNYFERLWA